MRSSSTRTNPGSPPLYEQSGRPSASAVARKNMSPASIRRGRPRRSRRRASCSSILSAGRRVSNRLEADRLPALYRLLIRRVSHPRGLVEVEQGRADAGSAGEITRSARNAAIRAVASACPCRSSDEHEAREHEHDHERRERAERVDVVGAREPHARGRTPRAPGDPRTGSPARRGRRARATRAPGSAIHEHQERHRAGTRASPHRAPARRRPRVQLRLVRDQAREHVGEAEERARAARRISACVRVC